jgi:hypothetical protein
MANKQPNKRPRVRHWSGLGRRAVKRRRQEEAAETERLVALGRMVPSHRYLRLSCMCYDFNFGDDEHQETLRETWRVLKKYLCIGPNDDRSHDPITLAVPHFWRPDHDRPPSQTKTSIAGCPRSVALLQLVTTATSMAPEIASLITEYEIAGACPRYFENGYGGTIFWPFTFLYCDSHSYEGVSTARGEQEVIRYLFNGDICSSLVLPEPESFRIQPKDAAIVEPDRGPCSCMDQMGLTRSSRIDLTD